MTTSDTISKANVLKPAEDFNKLRREGIVNIEKLAGDVWTDYNTHDPGITLLEALCYAITDLAYRTGFEMKDLLAQKTSDSNAWKNIFYTAREILPCNPLTINDYRKLIIDVAGVRNAWITISKDYEVPIYLNRQEIKFDDINAAQTGTGNTDGPCGCKDKIKLGEEEYPGLHCEPTTGDKVIELNGLYKIIVEYEEEIIENNKESEIEKKILRELHKHRNVCEDFLGVYSAKYKDFFLQAEVALSETADPEMVLAEMCYHIQNYFTPPIKFYSLDEMKELGKTGDEIFDGPALKHGFILEEDLEKTDLFRDSRLSDILSEISDIEGVNALNTFMINDPENPDADDPCSGESFFDEWIEEMKKEKLVGWLSTDDLVKFLKQDPEETASIRSKVIFRKPSGDVIIDPDRFEKLLNDLKGKDKLLKLSGLTNNFPVPLGEDMQLNNFYPVQYELPFTYRVGESDLPLRDGKTRLIQSLQLKGYLAVFEQLFLNYMQQLGNLNTIFSFNDIKFKGETKHKDVESACEPEVKLLNEHIELPESSYNQIIYKNEQNEIEERIKGYKCLYYDANKYLNELQSIIEPEIDFENHRNQMLDHLLARFSEEMNEYESLMKYIYRDDYLIRIIKNKTDLLADYPAISNNRSRAFNYKLEEECIDYANENWDEEKIAANISGLEKRIARLLGFKNYRRKDLAPRNLFVEKIVAPGKSDDGKIKIVLYENNLKEKVLLETYPAEEERCCDELTHRLIESGCCGKNFKKYPEEQGAQQRKHSHLEGFRFILKDSEGNEIAGSPSVPYKTAVLRDEALQRTKCLFERICNFEGLHLVENILLRPKGDFSVEDESQGSSLVNFELLNICIDECDLLVTQDVIKNPDFGFEIKILPPEKCLHGKRWYVKLSRLSDKVAILEKTFREYELASEFIKKIREYGSDENNYVIYKTKDNSHFYFKLNDENEEAIAESSCFLNFKELNPAGPGDLGTRSECKSLIEKEELIITDHGISETIEGLIEFLAYELDLYCCEESCNHNEDPYSFRLIFVLPCWTRRFRNKGFRDFAEKTIRSETPAHISPQIYWLGIEDMRSFDENYFNWIIEMACNEVPDVSICNNFISIVNELKNCNTECKEESEMAAPEAIAAAETMKKKLPVRAEGKQKISATEKKAGIKPSEAVSKEKKSAGRKKK